MAKRRVTHDEELPFVALMDTMTNVVGVLIIVLVMIAISLASSVKKVLSDLPPVTVEQLQELLKKIADTTPKEDAKKVADETKKLQEELKKVTEELKTVDVTDKKDAVKAMDPDEITKQIEDQKKARELKKLDIEKQFAEIDRLKALLDSTPVYQPPPATVVKLPNPREMPPDAVRQRFMVANGRVTYLNDIEFMKYIVTEVEKNKKSLMYEGVIKDAFGEVISVMEKGKKEPKPFFDRKKIMAHFERLRMTSKDIKVELIGFPNSSRLQMRLTPTPDGGDTLENVNNPASVFQRAARKFKSEPKDVIWFSVFRDSLPTYLATREVADQIEVPVGWALVDNAYYQVPITTFEVDYIPTKPAPPPPPGTVVIKPPTDKLD